MLDLEKFQKLLKAYEGDEQATAFLLSCARAFMEYAHAIYEKELARYAYPREKTEEAIFRATMKELDNAVMAAHDLVLANGAGLNRMAAKVGMPILYRQVGVGVCGDPVLSFVGEVLAVYNAEK